MSDENVESHTLVLLREIRDRLDRVEKTQDQHSAALAQHSQTLEAHGVLLDRLVKAVTAIDENQQKQTEILKGIAELGRHHGARLNVIDGRLGLIEVRVGLAHA
jgi:hypothetical protein